MDDRQTPEPKALVLTNIPRYPIKDIRKNPGRKKLLRLVAQSAAAIRVKEMSG